MAKNRKSERTAVRFAPALKTFLLCLLIGGAGLGYVAQDKKIKMLSERRKDLESKYKKLEDQRQNLLRKLANLQTFSELELQMRKMNLELSPMPPDRIVHLVVKESYPSRNPVELRDPRQLAQMTLPR